MIGPFAHATIPLVVRISLVAGETGPQPHYNTRRRRVGQSETLGAKEHTHGYTESAGVVPPGYGACVAHGTDYVFIGLGLCRLRGNPPEDWCSAACAGRL